MSLQDLVRYWYIRKRSQETELRTTEKDKKTAIQSYDKHNTIMMILQTWIRPEYNILYYSEFEVQLPNLQYE